MLGCVDAVLAQVVIAMFIPKLTHESEVTTDEYGNLDLSCLESGGLAATRASLLWAGSMQSLPDSFQALLIVCGVESVVA